MSKEVMMPVRCIGELCKTCPELETSVDTTYMYSDGGEFRFGYVNVIYCTKYRRCEKIQKNIEQNMKKEDENHESGNDIS
jgi:hypothetical protein